MRDLVENQGNHAFRRANTRAFCQGILQFDQDSPPLDREDYLEPEYADKLAMYERYVNNWVGMLAADAGSRVSPQQIAKNVKDMIAFEKQLAAIVTPEEDRGDPQKLYNLARLSDLYRLVPQVIRELRNNYASG
jgi:predicted metalloendopeptidase